MSHSVTWRLGTSLGAEGLALVYLAGQVLVLVGQRLDAEHAVRAAHRLPQGAGVVEIAVDQFGALVAQCLGGRLGWIAYERAKARLCAAGPR